MSNFTVIFAFNLNGMEVEDGIFPGRLTPAHL